MGEGIRKKVLENVRRREREKCQRMKERRKGRILKRNKNLAERDQQIKKKKKDLKER